MLVILQTIALEQRSRHPLPHSLDQVLGIRDQQDPQSSILSREQLQRGDRASQCHAIVCGVGSVQEKIPALNRGARPGFNQSAGAAGCGTLLSVAKATFIKVQDGDG